MTESGLLKGESSAGGRSSADVTSLLVEFGRALKAHQFYELDDPKLALVLGQAIRAWQTDLKRWGPLAIEVGTTGIRVPALGLKVASVQVASLLECLTRRGVRSLDFGSHLESEAFAALVDLLAREPDAIESERGIEQALYQRAPTGLVMNQVEPDRSLPRRSQAANPTAAQDPVIAALHRRQRSAQAPTPAPELECDPKDLPQELEVDDEVPAPTPGPEATPEAPLDATPAVAADAAREPTPTSLPAPTAQPESTPPDAEDTRHSQARHLMGELSGCDDDLVYNDLSRRLQMLATRLADEGDEELYFDAVELLAKHAGDDGKRSPRQQELALDQLATLASGPRLEMLIDRACGTGARSGVAATQVLLQLGEHAVRTLFEAAEGESDPNRRGQMHGILIAMGDAALPELLQAMDGAQPGRVRSAVRLAGEMQNPGAVPRLEALLASDDASERQEAAKALVRIGDPRAIEVLASALHSPVSDVPSLAAFCLGAAGTARAAQALLQSLDEATAAHRFPFAVEVIRALGRLGRAEATPALADLVLRRSIRRRRQFRDLKLAATAALGRLPGDDAVGALAQAAQSRDTQLRRAAQTALDRRANAIG